MEDKTQEMERIQELLNNKHYVALIAELAEMNAVDVAEILDKENAANAVLRIKSLVPFWLNLRLTTS